MMINGCFFEDIMFYWIIVKVILIIMCFFVYILNVINLNIGESYIKKEIFVYRYIFLYLLC